MSHITCISFHICCLFLFPPSLSGLLSLALCPSQAWKKCRSRDLGSDKTADFGIKFGETAILVRVSRIKCKTGWDKIYIFSRPAHAQCSTVFNIFLTVLILHEFIMGFKFDLISFEKNKLWIRFSNTHKKPESVQYFNMIFQMNLKVI